MDRSISARRVATLVGDFDRTPAYAGLADALVLLIGDGRIPVGTRLPSERELTEALGVSRTTVTRAYASAARRRLRRGAAGLRHLHAGARRRAPGPTTGPCSPSQSDRDAIDLNCAAPFAPPQIATAYAEAATRLPAYLGGHGYFPAGLPELQAAIAAHVRRAAGCRPTRTRSWSRPGALSGGLDRGPGADRPRRPGAGRVARLPQRRRARSAAPAPGWPRTEVDPDGWDLDATAATLRQVAPRLAYLIPDFQNPTGLLMSDERARAVRRRRCAARHVAPVVDEAHQVLALERPGDAAAVRGVRPDTITVGSASKSFWGGLRVGWVRAPHDQMDRLTRARVTLDLGVAGDGAARRCSGCSRTRQPTLTGHRARLREQRDALVAAVRDALPDWRFRVPDGRPGAVVRAARARPRAGHSRWPHEAERHGVIVAPGPVFAAEGGLDRFVRIPWTRREDELRARPCERVAAAWDRSWRRQPRDPAATAGRVMVA